MPARQGCCGALALHAGDARRARARAATLLGAFPEDVDAVVTNAAGCGSAMKEYGDVFRGSPQEDEGRRFSARVRDVAEFLHDARCRAAAPSARAVDRGVPRRMSPRARPGHPHSTTGAARAVSNLRVVEIPDGEICCGSAGLYNLEHPATAQRPRRTEGAGDPLDRRAGRGRREHRMPRADQHAPGPLRCGRTGASHDAAARSRVRTRISGLNDSWLRAARRQTARLCRARGHPATGAAVIPTAVSAFCASGACFPPVHDCADPRDPPPARRSRAPGRRPPGGGSSATRYSNSRRNSCSESPAVAANFASSCGSLKSSRRSRIM